MNIFELAAPHFEKYITIHELVGAETYNYAKRSIFNQPIVLTTRHRPKCAIGESWMYVAIPKGTCLSSLASTDRLYVGAQTQDRMFRGDDLEGNNFHHTEMRKGKEACNLIQFLQTGKEVEIWRVPSQDLARLVTKGSDLSYLAPVLDMTISKRNHLGYWFEQAVLHYEYPNWRWNSTRSNKTLSSALSNSAT